MTTAADRQSMDTVAQQEFVVANAPDCPSCEKTPDTHVVKQGDDALRGDGIYCGVCETFIAEFPDITS